MTLRDMRTLHSGSKAQDKGNSKNSGLLDPYASVVSSVPTTEAEDLRSRARMGRVASDHHSPQRKSKNKKKVVASDYHSPPKK